MLIRVSRLNDAGLIIAATVLPMYLSMFRYEIAGILIRVADLSVLFMMLLALISGRLVRVVFSLLTIYSLIFFMAYIVFQGVMLNQLAINFKELVQFFWLILAVALIGSHAKDNPDAFFKYLIIFLAISCAYTVLYHISQGSFVRFKLAGDGKYAFGLLSTLIFFRLGQTQQKKYLLLMLVSMVPLFLSLERKGIFGFFLVVLLWITVFWLPKRLNFDGLRYFVVIASFLLAMVWGGKIGSQWEQLLYDDMFIDESLALYTSNIHRQSLLVNGLDLALDNFWLGIGPDNITDAIGMRYFDPRLGNGTHNFYLDTWVSYGFFGLMLLAFFMVSVVVRTRRRFNIRPEYFLFALYCWFVAGFMSNGSAVLMLVLFPVFVPFLMNEAVFGLYGRKRDD